MTELPGLTKATPGAICFQAVPMTKRRMTAAALPKMSHQIRCPALIATMRRHAHSPCGKRTTKMDRESE